MSRFQISEEEYEAIKEAEKGTKLHKAVRVLMPNAILVGFTGTPLLKDDKEKSIETFSHLSYPAL